MKIVLDKGKIHIDGKFPFKEDSKIASVDADVDLRNIKDASVKIETKDQPPLKRLFNHRRPNED